MGGRSTQEGCTDCPRACAARGPASFCGVDRPGRVYWRGVTLLEEHEIAPTYEIYFTGCSLRCRFCTVPQAIEHPAQGQWMPPEDLVAAILAPEVPPFRTISLVGGDPTVNRPYTERLVPLLREALPGTPLVLNTNLFLPPELARRDARDFDWIVGDLHFWEDACARRIAGSRSYPAAARAAAEAVLDAGGRLILRLLLLPGHLDCCLRPSLAWAATLAQGRPGSLRVHLMLHYAPAGRARGDPELGRHLYDEERQLALRALPPGLPLPLQQALADVPRRPAGARDPELPIEIGPDGVLLLPFVTGELLPLAIRLQPGLAERLVYLQAPPDPLSRSGPRP